MRRLRLLIPTIALSIAAIMPSTALAGHTPTAAQVRHEISVLQKRVDTLNQEYDGVLAQLISVRAEATTTRAEISAVRTVASAEQKQVEAIAVTLYEQGGSTNPLALLTSPGSAQAVLSKGSIEQEISSQDSVVLSRFYAELSVLRRYERLEARQRAGADELAAQARSQRRQMETLTGQLDALLGIYPAMGMPVNGATSGHYGGPTNTQAGMAVEFAYAQLGCIYTWGGTGPCSSGFDCSGLVMQAWAFAGVQIPRTSQEQWAQLPHVSVSEMRPGDLMILLGGDHVGMYVGNGYMIDAPHTGAVVEKIPVAGWPMQNLVGVVRP